MLTRKTLTLIAAGGAVMTAVAATGIGAGLRDREEAVQVIRISEGRAVPATSSGATSQQVEGLDEVRGPVERRGDDVDDIYVGRVELDFGPDGWVGRAGPGEDYDRDGTAEALRAEIDGLVGNEARFLVRLDQEGDDGDVYAINDLTYRDPAGPPPWMAGPDAASEDQVRQAAADAVGPGARVVDLEADDGRSAWEAEVLDTGGREYDVDLDATGKVLNVEQD